ncbi:MAG TPA: hypothetical protein VIT93_03230 [Dehalococcoidia bacterium]
MSDRFEIRVSPLRVALFLATLAGLLLIAHLAAEGVRTTIGEDLPDRATGMWNLDEENNVPTWFASMLLALVGFGLVLVGLMKYQERDRYWWQWFAIALIPFFLSLDDMSQLHEALSSPLSEEYGFGGLLHWAWVVVALPAVGVLTILFLPFLRHLPARTLILLLAGAGMVFGGGVILEMFEGWWVDANGSGGVIIFSMVTVQEVLELLGSIIALYAVIDYAAGYRPDLVFRLERDELPFASVPQRSESAETTPAPEPAERLAPAEDLYQS